MTTRRLWLGAALALSLCSPTVSPAEVRGEVNLFVGQKSIDLMAPGPVDDVEQQDEFGVTFSMGDVDWPVMIALDILSSSSDAEAIIDSVATQWDFSSIEFDLGVRKFWFQEKKWGPYVGGGFGVIYLKGRVVEDASFLIKDDESDVSFWADAGVSWRPAPKFVLGLDVRYSDAEATLTSGQAVFDVLGIVSESDFDSGGVHVGLTGGYRW